MQKAPLLILLALSCTWLKAQTNLDSLYTIWEDEDQTDSIRTNAYAEYISFGFLSSNPDSAFFLAEAMIAFGQEKERPMDKAKGYHIQGNSFYKRSNYPQALDYYQRSLKIQEEIGNKKGMAFSIRGIGNSYYAQANYPQALVYYQRNVKLQEELGNKSEIANLLNYIGVIFGVQGNSSQALDYYQRSLKISEEIGDKSGIAFSLNNIGEVYYSQGNYPQALDYYQRSLKISEEIGLKKRIAFSLSYIGNIYFAQGNHPQALDYYQRSLKVKEEIGGRVNGIENELASIGNVYYSQNNYPEALDYFQRSLKISEERNFKVSMAYALESIGNVYGAKGNYSQSLDYFQRSLKICEEIGDIWGIAGSLNGIGTNLKKQANYPQALDYYQRCLKICEELGEVREISSALDGIGSIYLAQGRYYDAIAVCQRSLSLGEETGAIDSRKTSCSCLYEAYKGLGKSSKALEFHEQLTILSDSLFNEENTKKLTQLAMQYDFDKQEAATQLEQEKKDAIAAQELKRKNLERNGFIGGFAVMLLFAGIFFRQRNRIGKEKERSEELLMNILPKEVAEELKEKGHSDAQLIDQVTVLFTDFKGFTALSEQLSPKELVADLHTCFSKFDRICEKYGIEKIKTIGDAYMAAGGLPTPSTTHAQDVVKATLEMAEVIEKAKAEKTAANQPFFEVRIGVHTGPVVAGIVGVKKFQYDIWGDTVNTASRMESSGDVGKVNISEATFELVKEDSEFVFESRGKIAAKGKGEMEMYFVEKS